MQLIFMNASVFIVTPYCHPVLVKKGESSVRFVSFFLNFCPPVDGAKDPWACVLSLPERFVGDPASLACNIIF